MKLGHQLENMLLVDGLKWMVAIPIHVKYYSELPIMIRNIYQIKEYKEIEQYMLHCVSIQLSYLLIQSVHWRIGMKPNLLKKMSHLATIRKPGFIFTWDTMKIFKRFMPYYTYLMKINLSSSREFNILFHIILEFM